MAGSSTHSMENLGAQGMERHQFMMNNEFMKHFGIMNRASVREIMLQHERTFKEQVHDLHKLYEVQRLLMEKAKGSGQPLSAQVSALPEASPQSEQQARNFWEQLPSGSERVVSGGQSASTGQDKSKSSNSTVRKRKIDLEQLPTDDSDDDEMGSTLDAFNPITSELSNKTKEVTQGHHGHTNMVMLNPRSMWGRSGLHPFQSSQGDQINTPSRRDSGYGGTPNFLAVNSIKADQSTVQVVSKSPPFQNGNVLNDIGSDAGKSNGCMPLLQPDLTNGAFKGAGREAPCFPQSSNAQVQNMGSHSIRVSSQPLQHPHLPAPQLPFDKSHQQNGIFQGSPALEPQHGNKKSVPMENLLGTVGEWIKAPTVDSKPPLGLQAPPEPPRVWAFTSPKKPGDIPKLYVNETFPKATQLGSIAPLAMAETRPAEGGHAFASLITPALASANSKGLRQEHDTTVWSPQKPVMQHVQIQQQTSLSPQVLPALNQAIWLPSPQKSQKSLYSQQIVYGGHLSDASHIGYLSEALPKNQSDATGTWSMTGLGHYYSSAGPLPQQKPPFKKPPKLVLKNDGAGMELRLASPEGEDLNGKTSQKKLLASGDELIERTCQRKPLSSVKDSPRSSSESRGRKPDAKRETGKEQKHVDTPKPSEIQGSTLDTEPSTVFSGLCVSMPAVSHVQENILPWMSTTQNNHVSQILVNSSGLLASSAPALNGIGAPSLPPQGTNASRRKDQETLMEQLEQISTGAPLSTSQDALTKGGLQGHSLPAMGNGSSFMKGDAVDEGHDAPLSPGRDVLTKGDLQGHSLPDMRNNMSLMKVDAGGYLTSHGGDYTLVPIGSREPLLTPASSMTPEDAKATLSRASAPQECAFEVIQTGRSEPSSMEPQDAAMFCEKRAEGSSANLCHKEDKSQKGTHASQLAALEKDALLIRNEPQGTLLHHGFEMSPSRHPVMPAVSMQSTSSGAPGFIKEEKKTCSIGGLENSASHRAAGKSSSVHQSRTATPTYDRDCPSFMSESRPDTPGNVSSSSEDFQQDSESDNLAATILLSFAPKTDLQHREKPPKDNTGSSSAGSRKRKLADRSAASRTRQLDCAMAGVQSEVAKSKDGQRPRILVQCSAKKVGHAEPVVKSRMKDGRREEQCAAEVRAVRKGGEAQRSGALKLPRVVAMGSLTDEAVPTWKSKRLNKIAGATVSSKSANSPDQTKSKDVFHAPTGRRSSRGPPSSVRAHHHESKGRTQQPLDGGDDPVLTDWHLRSREEGGDSKKKDPEVNMKSKAWGDPNKARRHPRKQSDEVSHKKTQRWLSRERMP